MAANVTKGVSYTWAFARMKQAADSGYFLEAIAIAESVISDRLLSYIRSKGSKISVNQATVGALGKQLKERAFKTDDDAIMQLAADVQEWSCRRNVAVHAAAKSEPGTPTLPLTDFVRQARDAARDGRILARRVAKWHRETQKKDMSK